MITLKQMEALVWIARLGTFDRAAKKLCTTQSAISKRMRELERTMGIEIFDRSQRGARLTERGELLLDLAKEMLDMQSNVMRLGEEGHGMPRRISIGVTELSALTWFPKLITRLREVYSNLVVTPVVDSSRKLLQKLQDDELDIIVVAGEPSGSYTITMHLADVESVWMARRGLVDKSSISTLADLANYPILAQGSESGTGNFYKKWLKSNGFTTTSLASDNLIALVGLTVAGLGVCYLPFSCYEFMIEQEKLEVIDVDPKLPPVPYYLVHQSENTGHLVKSVSAHIVDVCDFSKQYQV